MAGIQEKPPHCCGGQGGTTVGEMIRYSEVEDKVLAIRGESVILDKDVAELYGVETRRVNEAVSNNPDKFPDGYVIALDSGDLEDLRSKISTANVSPMSRVPPKAFTEKGLYMLATILKSPRATETTIAIVETFAKMRELSRVMAQLPAAQDKDQQKALMERGGEILSDVIDDAFDVVSDEATIEIDLAIVKFKRTVKREKRKQ